MAHTLDEKYKLMQSECKRLETELLQARGAAQMLRVLIQEQNTPQPEAVTVQPQPVEVIEQKQE